MTITAMLRRWLRNALESLRPHRRLIVIEGDSLPSQLPKYDLVLAREDGEDWCVGMRCPCGCGRVLELLVFNEAKPRWKVQVSANGLPTLTPSVWLQKGCRSHFWIRDGQVHWC